MRTFRSPDQWRQILEDQQQSGLTISEFCRQQKISVVVFSANERSIEQSMTRRLLSSVQQSPNILQQKYSKTLSNRLYSNFQPLG